LEQTEPGFAMAGARGAASVAQGTITAAGDVARRLM